MGGGQSGQVSWPGYMQNWHTTIITDVYNRTSSAVGNNPFISSAFDPTVTLSELDTFLGNTLANAIAALNAFSHPSQASTMGAIIPVVPAMSPNATAPTEVYPTEYVTIPTSGFDAAVPTVSETVSPEYVNIPDTGLDATAPSVNEVVSPEYVVIAENLDAAYSAISETLAAEYVTITPGTFDVTALTVNEDVGLDTMLLNTSQINADVAAFDAQLTDILDNQSTPAVKAGFLNINAVNTSAFPIAIAIMQGLKNRDVAKHSSTLRVELQTQLDRLNATLMGQHREQIQRLRALGYELNTRISVTNADRKAQLFTLQEDINSRLKLGLHEIAARVRIANAELGTRVILANQDTKLKLRTLEYDINSRLKLEYHEGQVRLRTVGAELSSRHSITNRDRQEKLIELEEEINSRLKLEYHQGQARLRALGAELSAKVGTDNRDRQQRIQQLEQDINSRLKLQNHEAISRIRVQFLQSSTQWGLQARELDHMYWAKRNELIRSYVISELGKVGDVARSYLGEAPVAAERTRMKVVSQTEFEQLKTSYRESGALWQLEASRVLLAALGSISGGGGGHMSQRRPSAAMSALSGAAGGAAAGSAVNVPYGTAVGAIVGAGLALASR